MAPVVLVGVGAGIAAYKAAILVRELMRSGCQVRVIPTPRSLDFVGAATWEGLTAQRVITGLTEEAGRDHIELARNADLIVVAPATADLLARIRAGIADDLLTTTILAARCPIVLSPAMHSQMWENPATAENVAVLRSRGMTIIDPDTGALNSGDSGVGRLPAPERIARRALDLLLDSGHDDHAPAEAQRLEGVRVLVTAGGTREPIDPVRFIGNHSSGWQGIHIARAAHALGAKVVLVASNIESALLGELPSQIDVVSASRGAEVEAEVMSRLPDVDVLVMAAAIGDFRPVNVAEEKIKKDPNTSDAPIIELERTRDILASVATSPKRPAVLVGFAAETGTDEIVLERGREKAVRKGADLLVVNRVGDGHGFGNVDNSVVFLDPLGSVLDRYRGSKAEVGRALVSWIADRLVTVRK